MRWWPHIDAQGQTYSLNHLHPFRFVLPLDRGEVRVAVAFAMHCFTREATPEDDSSHLYSDEREERIFCPLRYELSSQLPEIIRDLANRTCYFARNDNFVTIDVVDLTGNQVRYAVFFNLKRPAKGTDVDILLTVQSAYSLDVGKQAPGHHKIKYRRLVELTLDDIKPRAPRR